MKTRFHTISVAPLLLILFLTAILPVSAHARRGFVEGSANFRQFGQPPESVVQKARVEAAANFREELLIWLREDMSIDLDTVNTVKNFALAKIVERCLESAEESTSTRGRVWTLTLSVPESAVKSAIDAHNAHFDAQAASHFATARGNDAAVALPSAVAALCAAVAKIEPPRGGRGVNVNEIRNKVQTLVNKMEVRVTGTVIEGRQGEIARVYPTATIFIDGEPLPNFHYTAFTQNSLQLKRMVTGRRGELPLREIRIPYAHNGSMLTVSPDARTHLGADRFIRYRDLGIRFTRNQELTFIYKLPTLTYTLDYRVFVQDGIVVTDDFNSDEHVRGYLRDFCGLVPAAGGAAPNMTIKIGAELFKETHRNTEEDVISMALRVDFTGAGINKSGNTVFEKRYSFGEAGEPQMGDFFWEASGAIRDLIAKVLSE
ncbi:MAG: hypothetical protein LBC70_02585 [Chitinispirillales bacterium]|jgi:hypothetical protein|nr:hypothetical protein [Chitinispirillales bacterium]